MWIGFGIGDDGIDIWIGGSGWWFCGGWIFYIVGLFVLFFCWWNVGGFGVGWWGDCFGVLCGLLGLYWLGWYFCWFCLYLMLVDLCVVYGGWYGLYVIVYC